MDLSPRRTSTRGRVAALLFELNELEEQAYRDALAHVEQVERAGRPSAALRAVLGHVAISLDDVRAMAAARHVRLGSLTALAVDAVRRLLDASTDRDDAGESARQTIGEAIALARTLRTAALETGDGELARWCARWLDARGRLTAAALSERAFAGAASRARAALV